MRIMEGLLGWRNWGGWWGVVDCGEPVAEEEGEMVVRGVRVGEVEEDGGVRS